MPTAESGAFLPKFRFGNRGRRHARQVTTDNQTATLSVTRAFPIFEITPGHRPNPAGAKITYTNLGTLLCDPADCRPKQHRPQSRAGSFNIDSKDRQIINGGINEANVYAIRRMETEVMIPSGNTLVMGGLISDNATKNYSKVPILGDIPIRPALPARHKSKNQVHLIIFVTPTIVKTRTFNRPHRVPEEQIPAKPDAEGIRLELRQAGIIEGKPGK